MTKNPINLAGVTFQTQIKVVIEQNCLQTATCKKYKTNDINTYLVKGTTIDCVENAPAFLWGLQTIHPDFTIWNPSTKKEYYVEAKIQTSAGSVQDKLYAAIGRDFLSGPTNCVYFYVYNTPGISVDYLKRLELDYSKMAAITRKQFKIFKSISEFSVYISQPLLNWM